MGARRLPRPPSVSICSSDEILEWLRYLCINSECRGLGGHELIDCKQLLDLDLITVRGGDTPHKRAQVLRETIKQALPSGDGPDIATLQLLGLTPSSSRQPRPFRRKLAADSLGMVLNTFEKRYESLLLRDVAEVLWGLEFEARKARSHPPL
jgi:hypothetical protein